MIFLVVILDDDLAGTEQCSQCREDGTESISRWGCSKISLQVGTILVDGCLCHQFGYDRQLVANELAAGVEEQEIGLLSDDTLQLVLTNLQQL